METNLYRHRKLSCISGGTCPFLDMETLINSPDEDRCQKVARFRIAK